jgi:hypothetical protein
MDKLIQSITDRSGPLFRLWVFLLTWSKYPILRINGVSNYDIGRARYSNNTPYTEREKLLRVYQNIPTNLCSFINQLAWHGFKILILSTFVLTVTGILLTFVAASITVLTLFIQCDFNHAKVLLVKCWLTPEVINFIFIVWIVISVFTIPASIIAALYYTYCWYKDYNNAEVIKEPGVVKLLFKATGQMFKDRHDSICRHLEFHD